MSNVCIPVILSSYTYWSEASLGPPLLLTEFSLYMSLVANIGIVFSKKDSHCICLAWLSCVSISYIFYSNPGNTLFWKVIDNCRLRASRPAFPLIKRYRSRSIKFLGSNYYWTIIFGVSASYNFDVYFQENLCIKTVTYAFLIDIHYVNQASSRFDTKFLESGTSGMNSTIFPRGTQCNLSLCVYSGFKYGTGGNMCAPESW